MQRKKPRDRKTVNIQFRGTKLDAARLKALARTWELTPSDTMRRLIREEHERLVGAPTLDQKILAANP